MASWNMSTPGIGDIKAIASIDSLVRLFLLWVAYKILVALYNISPLHPLSRFPGPKLAAMTILYEGWYDLIKVGRYTWEIQKMHDQYGASTRLLGGYSMLGPQKRGLEHSFQKTTYI